LVKKRFCISRNLPSPSTSHHPKYLLSLTTTDGDWELVLRRMFGPKQQEVLRRTEKVT
jgi:hypothetical protein